MAESSALQICPLIQRILPLRNQVTMLASQPFKFCLVDIIENKKNRAKVAFNQWFVRF